MPTVAKHQIRVVNFTGVLHTSGARSRQSAISRCRKQTRKGGIGAIGTVYEVTNKQTGEMRPIFTVRVAYAGVRGTPTLVQEDPAPPSTDPNATHPA